MDKHTLEQMVDAGLSQAKIARQVGCSPTSVRYWLAKHGLKTRRGPKGLLSPEMLATRQCPCGETDPAKFYGRKRHICGSCQSKYNLEYGRENRRRAIQFLGGRCTNPTCHFDRYQSALQVHHKDPKTKDPTFASYRGWSWGRIQRELEKCLLLCACCHSAVHAGELDITWSQRFNHF